MDADARCGIDLNPTAASDDALTTSDDAVTTSYEAVSTAVVNAVAEAKGVDPLDLDPLYDTVDPDALDALFSDADRGSSLEIRFTVAGCDVVVRGAGDVSVTVPARQGDAGAALASGD